MALSIVAGMAGCSFDHGRELPASDAPLVDAMIERSDAGRDAAADARVCPEMSGCTAFQCASTTSCYYDCTAKVSWMTAQNNCASVPNGCLVTINDQAEQNCVVANVNPTFANFPWTGYRQSGNGAEPAGGWSFQCGPSAYPPSWAPNEPNNVGDEDCAGMAEGGWFDTGCSESGRYVCEVP